MLPTLPPALDCPKDGFGVLVPPAAGDPPPPMGLEGGGLLNAPTCDTSSTWRGRREGKREGGRGRERGGGREGEGERERERGEGGRGEEERWRILLNQILFSFQTHLQFSTEVYMLQLDYMKVRGVTLKPLTFLMIPLSL